jgi:hypothetical protein
MKTFLGFSFHEQDRILVQYAEQLLASQYVQIVSGERLGGEQLTPAVQNRIEECEALVALLTRRDARQDGKWTTHQWVLDELNWARGKQKRAIAMVEDGVDIGGMFQSHEQIPFRRADPIEAFLRLSETLGMWKREIGRTVKVQLMPPPLAKKLGGGNGSMQCRSRLWLQGRYTEWRNVNPVPEEGGAFVYVDGVQDEHLIQLQVQGARTIWQSTATSQWMQVRLAPGGGK